MRANCDFKQQSGSFLLEFILIAAISVAIAVWGTSKLSRQAKELQAQSLANWMLLAQNGIQSYLDANYQLIIENINAMGHGPYNQQIKPDWQFLRQNGYLNRAWNENGPARQKLSYEIKTNGNCADKSCHLQALLYTATPAVNKQNQPDLSFIASWLQAVKGQGLVLQNNDAFIGAGMSVAAPSNINANGTLALLIDKSDVKLNETVPSEAVPDGDDVTTDNGDYLVVGDQRNPNFQADLTVKGVISNESYTYTKGLFLDNKKQINDVCANEFEISHNNLFTGLLVCDGEKFQPISYPRAGGYMMNTKRGCKNSTGQSTANPVTGQCSCPTMHTNVQISESGSLTGPDGINIGYICVFM